jgi:mRNA interferase YafQ
MKFIVKTGAFKRDSKLAVRRGYDVFKLQEIIRRLQDEEPLPAHCRPHLLQGKWRGHWECHIEPNWILIYKIFEDRVELGHTGTHADLFE